MQPVKNFLRLAKRRYFSDDNSGPRPNVLVIVGIAMGLQKSVLDRYEGTVAEELVDKRLNFGL